MEVNGQLHSPVAFPPRKEHLTLTEQEAVWAPEPVGREPNPEWSTLQPSHYTDYASQRLFFCEEWK
jgi:hypothetical protein